MKKAFLYSVRIQLKGLFVLVACIMLSSCQVSIEEPTQTNEPKKSDAQICADEGGTWAQLTDACVDMCGRENMQCAQVVTMGCDCGAKCWDGKTCK